jgi:hypothetical protein
MYFPSSAVLQVHIFMQCYLVHSEHPSYEYLPLPSAGPANYGMCQSWEQIRAFRTERNSSLLVVPMTDRSLRLETGRCVLVWSNTRLPTCKVLPHSTICSPCHHATPCSIQSFTKYTNSATRIIGNCCITAGLFHIPSISIPTKFLTRIH